MGVLPGPVSATVTRLLTALEQLVEEVPSISDELDILAEELHAKRLSIAALRAELSAMDSQLEVLERTLAPVQSWSRQWSSTRKAWLAHSGQSPLRILRADPGPHCSKQLTSRPAIEQVVRPFNACRWG